MIPFSILWAGFAFSWEASVVGSGAPSFFALWGIPFVLMGLYITVGRFFVGAWQRGRTQYGVTNDRILIVTGGLSPSIKSLNLRTPSDVTVEAKPDGSGTVTFGPTNLFMSMYRGMAWPGMKMAPSFDQISDARSAYDAVRQAPRESSAAGVA